MDDHKKIEELSWKMETLHQHIVRVETQMKTVLENHVETVRALEEIRDHLADLYKKYG